MIPPCGSVSWFRHRFMARPLIQRKVAAARMVCAANIEN
jgi:hypothetical protein